MGIQRGPKGVLPFKATGGGDVGHFDALFFCGYHPHAAWQCLIFVPFSKHGVWSQKIEDIAIEKT